MALKDNLVSYWKLNTNSNDSVASNNGTDTNVAYDSSIKIAGGSLDVRSTSTSKVIIADSASWDTGTGDFSISCWAYQTTGTVASGLITISDNWTSAPTKRVHLDMQGTGNTSISFGFYDSVSGVKYAVAVWASGANLRNGWHHIVGTRAAGVATIYVDGISKATASNTTGVSANANITGVSGINIGIGDYGSSNWERFQGYIDEVGFWNRALIGDEVALLYNGGSGLTYPFGTGAILAFFN